MQSSLDTRSLCATQILHFCQQLMCKRKPLLSIGDYITFFVITQNYAGIV